jgi:hypothetical protein
MLFFKSIFLKKILKKYFLFFKILILKEKKFQKFQNYFSDLKNKHAPSLISKNKLILEK